MLGNAQPDQAVGTMLVAHVAEVVAAGQTIPEDIEIPAEIGRGGDTGVGQLVTLEISRIRVDLEIETEIRAEKAAEIGAEVRRGRFGQTIVTGACRPAHDAGVPAVVEHDVVGLGRNDR